MNNLLKNIERIAQTLWQKKNITGETPLHTKEFVIDVPPPNASGTLHIGHLFSYSHIDICIRYKKMSGYKVFFSMGLDNNGLATERYLEKKYKKDLRTTKLSELKGLLKKESRYLKADYELSWLKLGFSLVNHPQYMTAARDVQKLSQDLFIKLYEKKKIAFKESPAWYCPSCKTFIGEFETEYWINGPEEPKTLVHERCKQKVERLVAKKWFFDFLADRKKILKGASNIKWNSQVWRLEMLKSINSMELDWCLSRQRFLGAAFPVLVCNSCHKVIVAPTDHNLQKCPQCLSEELMAETDVMDTWFVSSFSPQINFNKHQGVLKKDLHDIRFQAHDIINTWAFYTLASSLELTGKAPWKRIFISGHVLTENRFKISKSDINCPFNVHNIFQKWSSDAIRYWACSKSSEKEVLFTDEIINQKEVIISKLWDMFSTLKDYIRKPSKPVADSLLPEHEKLFLKEFQQTTNKVMHHFDRYQFDKGLKILENFFLKDFNESYKRVFVDGQRTQSTPYLFYEISFGLLQLYGPIIPYMTEILYQVSFRNTENYDSIHSSIFDRNRSLMLLNKKG